jgi:hypothetical protein
LLLKVCFVGNFPAGYFFLQTLFDNGDLFAREAVEGIDKLVDLGLEGGNIRVLSASALKVVADQPEADPW